MFKLEKNSRVVLQVLDMHEDLIGEIGKKDKGFFQEMFTNADEFQIKCYFSSLVVSYPKKVINYR